MDSLISAFDAERDGLEKKLADTLSGCDDGELFLEYVQSESLVFDNGKLKAGNFHTDQGFGLRAVAGEASAYAHSGEMTLKSLERAADAVSAVKGNHTGTYADAPARTNRHLYPDLNPLGAPTFEEKVKLLQKIDAYARDADPRVRQVTASVAGSYQVVEILRADGQVGSSLQAAITLTAPPEDHALLASLGDDLKFVFITSAIDLIAGSALQISVKASSDAKCERCWHYRSDVGHDAAHATLCGRCTSNLYGAGENRVCA